MKKKVECTHIISQLRNIKKYKDAEFETKDGRTYIRVDEKWEFYGIAQLEFYTQRALWWYKNLIEETSK